VAVRVGVTVVEGVGVMDLVGVVVLVPVGEGDIVAVGVMVGEPLGQ
jgi:hypothetical protein